MNEHLFSGINDFARATSWLHSIMRGYATFGVLLFAVFLAAAWWYARRHSTGMSAAVWAPLGTLLAVAVNQPLVAGGYRIARRPLSTLLHTRPRPLVHASGTRAATDRQLPQVG